MKQILLLFGFFFCIFYLQTATTSNSALSEYVIGVLQTNEDFLPESSVVMKLAMDSINDPDSPFGSILSRNKVKLILNTTYTGIDNIEKIILQLEEMVRDTPNLIGFIGPPLSALAVPVTERIGNKYKKPIVSFSATSSVLSNKQRFKYFMRMLPAESLQVEAAVDFCGAAGWTSIVTLISKTSDELIRYAENEMKEMAAMRKIDVTDQIHFKSNNRSNLEAVAQNLTMFLERKPTVDNPIVFVVVIDFEEDLIDFIRALKRLKLLDKGFIWLFGDPFYAVARILQNEMPVESTGLIYIEASNGIWERDSYLNSLLKKGIGQYQAYDSVSPFAFDAALSYGHAVARMLSNGVNLLNGDQMLAHLKSNDFLGVSGHMRVNGKGDRVTNVYLFKNLHPNSTIPIIARWNYQDGFKREEGVPVYISGTVEFEIPAFRFVRGTLSGTNQWFTAPSTSLPPTPRHSYSMALVEDEEIGLLVFGGSNAQLNDDVWFYDFKRGHWEAMLTFNKGPSPREGALVFYYHDYMYLFSGFDGSAFLNDLWRLELNDRLWEPVPIDYRAAPTARTRAFGVLVDDYYYIFGGSSTTSLLNDLWRYDIENNVFEFIEPTGTTPNVRDYGCAVHYNGSIIVWGGRSDRFDEGSADMWVYNIEKNKWFQVNQLNAPYPRHGHGCAAYQERLFLTSGWNEKHKFAFTTRSMDDLHMVDLNFVNQLGLVDNVIANWTCVYLHIPNGYAARDSISPVVFDDYLIIFGGWGFEEILNDLWRIDISQNFAVQKIHGNMQRPMELNSLSAGLVGNTILFFGGINANNKVSNELYSFNTDTFLWKHISVDLAPPPRYDHSAAFISDLMYIFGGVGENGEERNDLWQYSFLDNSWVEIQQKGIASIQLPTPRRCHTSQMMSDANGTKMLIFGGRNKNKAFDEIWLFDLDTETWELVTPVKSAPDVTPFPYVINIQSALLDKRLVVYGGENPSDFHNGVVYVFDFNTYKWSIYAKLKVDQEASGPSLTKIGGGTVAMFGGVRFSLVNNQHLLISNNSITPMVNTEEQIELPAARTDHEAVFYGENLFVFGGVGATPNQHRIYTLSKSQVFSDIWRFRYSLEKHCNRWNDPNCWLCSPGTELRNGQCVTCPKGTFNELFGGTCQKCFAGYFSVLEGASSRRICTPCNYGTFTAQEGSAECLPCPVGKFCPIGSTIPLSESPSLNPEDAIPFTSQPPPFKPLDEEVATANIVALSMSAGIIAIIVIVMLLMYPRCHMYYYRLDLLFEEKHNFNMGYMERKRTRIGGIATVVACIGVPTLVFIILFPSIRNNTQEIRSLIPNLSARASQTFSNITTEITVIGYRGRCTVAKDSHECVSGIKVRFTGFDNKGEVSQAYKKSCHIVPSIIKSDNSTENVVQQCKVVATCQECGIGRDRTNAKITFSVQERETFATEYGYKVVTSTGYPTTQKVHDSIIDGRIQLQPRYLFRGMTNPTVVSLAAVGTTYEEPGRELSTGYHVDFIQQTIGDTVEVENYQYKNGISFSFDFQKAMTTLEVTRFSKKHWTAIISELLGGVNGLLAALTIILRRVETIEKWLLKRLNFDLKNKYTKKQVYKLRNQKLLIEQVKEQEEELKRKGVDLEKHYGANRKRNTMFPLRKMSTRYARHAEESDVEDAEEAVTMMLNGGIQVEEHSHFGESPGATNFIVRAARTQPRNNNTELTSDTNQQSEDDNLIYMPEEVVESTKRQVDKRVSFAVTNESTTTTTADNNMSSTTSTPYTRM